jgi:Glycosyl hydrolase family 47
MIAAAPDLVLAAAEADGVAATRVSPEDSTRVPPHQRQHQRKHEEHIFGVCCSCAEQSVRNHIIIAAPAKRRESRTAEKVRTLRMPSRKSSRTRDAAGGWLGRILVVVVALGGISSRCLFRRSDVWGVSAYVDEASSALSDRRYELYLRSLRDRYLLRKSSAAASTFTSSTSADGAAAAPGEGGDNATTSGLDATSSPYEQAAFATYLYAPFHQRHDVPEQQTPSASTSQSHRKKSDRAASLHEAFAPFPPSRKANNLQLIHNMFTHAYDAYMQNAYPVGEIKPISCAPTEFDLVKLPALTLIDSLDMLLIMGNSTEFVRSLERIRALYLPHKFAVDQNVSVFETNIRVLGGLLSAHQLAVAFLRHDLPDTRVLRDDVFDSDGDIRYNYEVLSRQLDESRQSVRLDDAPNGAAVECDTRDDEFRIQGGDHYPSSTPSGGSCSSIAPPLEASSSSRISFYHDVVVSALRSLNMLQHDQRRKQQLHAATTRMLVDSDASELFEVCTNLQDSLYSHNATSRADRTVTTTTRDRQRNKPQYYQYDGFLLDLALDLGNRLLLAFDTPTGIPYGTVNLLHGVPIGETPIASLAGGGTLSLEFHLLSKLTGDGRFGKAAKLATRALFGRHSTISRLYGKHST